MRTLYESILDVNANIDDINLTSILDCKTENQFNNLWKLIKKSIEKNGKEVSKLKHDETYIFLYEHGQYYIAFVNYYSYNHYYKIMWDDRKKKVIVKTYYDDDFSYICDTTSNWYDRESMKNPYIPEKHMIDDIKNIASKY